MQDNKQPNRTVDKNRSEDSKKDQEPISTSVSLKNSISKDNPRDKAMARSLVEMGVLNDKDMEYIDEYQECHQVTFEQAATALRKIDRDDVDAATASYYQYAIVSKKDRSRYSSDLVTAFAPHSHQAELFRSLRSRILQRTRRADAEEASEKCAFAVVSPDSGDGRTYLAANLAVAFAQLGKNTILLDMDLRAPRIHKIFNVSNHVGISDVFAENYAAPNCWHQIPFISSLVIVPSGPIPPNPQELISQPSFELFLNNLYEAFDFVIIDTPPSSHTADAEIIASRVNSAIVTSRKHNTDIKSLEATVSRLKANRVDVLGSVLNTY